MEAWRKELYHHGIKGQRWGVRKGPPYPLGAKEHSAAEKKAGWRSSVAVKQDADHKRITAVTKAAKRTRAAYTLSSTLNAQLSAPAVVKYAKIAKDLHAELSSKAGAVASKKKLPQELKVLSKPNEPSELHETPKPVTAKFLATLFPSIAKRQKQYTDYDIKNEDGKVVGDFSTNRNSADELNIVWLGVKGKYEGKGYGQSAMRLAIEDARKQGCKYVTLEVPGDSPNARHIYEKLGFKETERGLISDEDDVWGGLTEMRLDL